MAKRIKTNRIKKYAKLIGGLSIPLIILLFAYLQNIGAITINNYSRDMVCAGTLEDPCYAYLNFTANTDIYIYPSPNNSWLFSTDKKLKLLKVERKWGNGWREIKLNESCNGRWCGCYWCDKNHKAKYSYVFRKGKDYLIRFVGYKYNPYDDVKWSFGKIDPLWKGIDLKYKIEDIDKSKKSVTLDLIKDFNLSELSKQTGKPISHYFRLEKKKYFGDAKIKLMEKINITKTIQIPYKCNCKIKTGWKIDNETKKNITYTYKSCDTCYNYKNITKEEWREINPKYLILKKNHKIYEVFRDCKKIKKLPNGKWGCSVFTDVYILGQKIKGLTWWNQSWQWREPINISNTAGDLTNYQVRIDLNNSNVGSSFDWSNNGDDIRFTNSTDDLLNFWIESWNSTGQEATIWVNVTYLANNTNTTIYMYYGNSGASSVSNGTATFEFFDDFENYNIGDDPDSSKWNILEEGSNDVSIQNNPDGLGKVLKIDKCDSGNSLYAWAENINLPAGDYIFHYFWRYNDNTADEYNTIFEGDTAIIYCTADMDETDRFRWYDGSSYQDFTPTAPTPSINTWYEMEHKVTTSSYVFNFDGSDYTGGFSSTPTNGATRIRIYPSRASGTRTNWVDNFYVRKYADPEPTVSSFGSEENYLNDYQAPTYSDNSTNTTLAGVPTEFRVKWTDNYNLTEGGFIFSWHNGTNWTKTSNSEDLESGEQSFGPTATYTFFDDFDDGDLGSNWTTYSSDATYGRIGVRTEDAHSGSYSVIADVNTDDHTNLNELITNYDFSGATSVVLTFWHREWADEDTSGADHTDHYYADAYYFTCDGTNWKHLGDLGSPSGWTKVTVNITADPDWCGTADSNFKIKLTQYDNYALDTDGRGFDDINITYIALGGQEVNRTPVTYSDISLDTYKSLDNITISVYVSYYNNSGSQANGNTNPTLWLEVYNGTDWVDEGDFQVSGTGNYSKTITTASVLEGWKTESNRDIRISARYMDYNDSTHYDRINWTGVWVEAFSEQEFLNDSLVEFDSSNCVNDTVCWSNVTKVVSSNAGDTIKWKVYAKDWANNWNETPIYSYTTTSAGGQPDIKIEIWNGTDWILFNDTNLLEFRCEAGQTECEPTNQDVGNSQSIFKITNNGTGDGAKVEMKLNQTFTDITLKCDDDYTYADAVEITSSYQQIHGALAKNDYIYVSCWADYGTNPQPGYFDLSFQIT